MLQAARIYYELYLPNNITTSEARQSGFFGSGKKQSQPNPRFHVVVVKSDSGRATVLRVPHNTNRLVQLLEILLLFLTQFFAPYSQCLVHSVNTGEADDRT